MASVREKFITGNGSEKYLFSKYFYSTKKGEHRIARIIFHAYFSCKVQLGMKSGEAIRQVNFIS